MAMEEDKVGRNDQEDQMYYGVGELISYLRVLERVLEREKAGEGRDGGSTMLKGGRRPDDCIGDK